MPPASHQVSATSLKLLIQQIHPHERAERDSGMCVARDLYELWGRYSYLENQIFIGTRIDRSISARNVFNRRVETARLFQFLRAKQFLRYQEKKPSLGYVSAAVTLPAPAA
jgi:hypothetical protein